MDEYKKKLSRKAKTTVSEQIKCAQMVVRMNKTNPKKKLYRVMEIKPLTRDRIDM